MILTTLVTDSRRLIPARPVPFHLLPLATLAFVLTGVTSGADMTSQWTALERLKVGDRLVVQVLGRNRIAAQFGAVTDQTLQLVRGSEQIEFARKDVVRVERLRQRSRVRAAAPWIGSGAGFAIGFAYGYPYDGFLNTPIPKPVAGVVFGAGGAVVGRFVGHLLAGSGEERQELVYQQQ